MVREQLDRSRTGNEIVKGVTMAKENPDKPAGKGMSTDLDKKKPQKPKPSTTAKKRARTPKTTAKTKAAPKATKSQRAGKTKPAAEEMKKEPESSGAQELAVAAEVKKASARTTRKIKSEETPIRSSSAVNSSIIPPTYEESDTMNKMIIYGGGILALIVFLIVAAGLQNMGKYEIIDNNGVVEVWKGRFAPMGSDLMISMTGVEMPSQKKAVYTREDVYPLVFQFYLDQSDALMSAAGFPGFEEIKSTLKQAGAFASTPQERTIIDSRLKAVDRTVLIYKADMATMRGTADGLQMARVYLNKAANLKPDEIEANLIQQRLDSVQQQMEALRPGLASQPATPQATEAPSPAPKSDGHEDSVPAPAEEKKPVPIGGTT